MKIDSIAEPWINSLSAERHRRMGTPLAPGAVAAGWNSRANFSWKPDGTAVVFWQRGVEDPDKTRVVVSRLPQRPSGKAPKVRPTGTPRWAPRLNGYFPPTQRWPRSRRGRVSGRMIVEVHAAPATSKYRRFIHVRYRNFADRRGFVIHGVESGYYDLSGFFGGDSLYSARLTVSGRHHGFLAASKVAINAGSIDGTIASRLDGHRLRLGPLP